MQSIHKIILVGLVVFVVGGLVWYQTGTHRSGLWRGGYGDGYQMNAEMDHSRMRNSEMSTEMMNMMSALSGKTGDAFDRAFLEEMIKHHQGAVDMAQATLKNAERQELKDMAQSIISAQNAEIAQMKQWQNEWYGVPKPEVVPAITPSETSVGE